MPEGIPHLVSTIIPVYNRPAMLKFAAESVLQQTHQAIEIIIVDDGSTDETLQIANSIARQHPEKIRIIRQANSGPGPAREAGRVLARGEFIQYLDSDDRLLSNKFADQVALLQAHPECDIAYGITRQVDSAGTVIVPEFKWTNRDMPRLFPGLLIDRWWSTHTPLYSRKISDRVGPWSALRYSQDWEYDARMGALGARLKSTRTLVSEHYSHQGERQTGSGKWLSPRDQVSFFSTLHRSALKAGVQIESPEMQHFSRWVFAKARECGAVGDAVSASQLYEIAMQTTDSPDNKMKIVGIASRVLGWRLTGWVSQMRDQFGGPHFGPKTRAFSWSKEKPD